MFRLPIPQRQRELVQSVQRLVGLYTKMPETNDTFKLCFIEFAVFIFVILNK